MIRYAGVLLFNMIGFFICRIFMPDGDISVSQTVPSVMSPGNNYTIELTVNKGSIGGFAKLQQELPQGCSATPIDSKGASFSMSASAVKFIWTSLPSDASFTVSYKLTVASTAPPGANVLAGKFFYVTDNVKQSVEIPESNFSISGGTSSLNSDSAKSPTVQAQIASAPSTSTPSTPAPSKTNLDTNKSPAIAAQLPGPGSGELACSRKINVTGPSEYTVEITIDRGNTVGFAKLQENIPAGFSAIAVQNSGASFSFSDQKVKMVWINLPSDAEIKVSYKISGSASAVTIDGLFSYIENEETKKLPISATSVSGNNPATTAQAETKSQTQSAPPEQDNSATTKGVPNKDNLTTPAVPSPQTSVNYKVQVCALRKTPVNTSYFMSRFGLAVGQELHEGWTKYTVNGGFKEYKPARDFRENVRSKGVVNPFVTAYNSGKRITVQEALMITSQKWYP